MAVSFRSDADVTNGTAGTSVTVNQPSGLVDTGATTARDHMFACIGAVGAPSMTPPAGWTEVLSFTDETDAVTLWVYSKLADSEGASWTWTLGSSARSWGWVGAYIGVDPTDPTRWRRGGTQDSEVDSTFAVLTARTLPGWMDLISCAAVRTASGAATTWGVTSFAPDWDMGDPTERADLSTDEGSGTDITGVVGDASWTGAAKTVDAPFLLASQAQTAGVAALVGLRPYFTPYTGGIGDEGLLVEAAGMAELRRESTCAACAASEGASRSAWRKASSRVRASTGRLNKTAASAPASRRPGQEIERNMRVIPVDIARFGRATTIEPPGPHDGVRNGTGIRRGGDARGQARVGTGVRPGYTTGRRRRPATA
jgi:hypothetical protein